MHEFLKLQNSSGMWNSDSAQEPQIWRFLKKPETYDIFGLFTFAFITALSIWSLKTALPLPLWANIILLVIGIIGLIIDGLIVFKKFISKQGNA